MLQAELHNKERRGSLIRDMEDVLTSNVFGVLKNIDNYFLGRVLNKVLEVSFGRDECFTVDFWPTEYKYDTGLGFAAEPDCLISGSDCFILVEAKYHSGFGEDSETGLKIKNQLKREYELLLKHSQIKKYSASKCFLLIVTDDLFNPQEEIIQQFHPGEVPQNVCWINWEKIGSSLEEALLKYDNRCTVSKIWVEELVKLLKEKGFRGFRGFRELVDKLQLDGNIVNREFIFYKERIS